MAAKQTSKFPNISILKQFAESELIHALEAMPGEKDLVLDPDLMRPIDKFAGHSVLKRHGVSKIYKMEPGPKTLPGCSQRIYLVRAKVVTMKYIADQVNNEKDAGDHRSYKILMVPRKLHACLKILENEGVYGDVIVEDLPLNMFVLDDDLITMELPQFFKSLYLDGDKTWLHTVASALMTIEQVFGKIPNVNFIGHAAHIVDDLMKHLDACKAQQPKTSQELHIGHLFVIDRDVDYISALCSQVTYEGIMDETFGIKHGVMEFADASGDKVKLALSSDDQIYAQVRDKHFTNVFGFLGAKARDVQSGYDKRHGLKTVGDMKNFVGQELRGLQSQHKTLHQRTTNEFTVLAFVLTDIGASEIMMKKKTKGDFVEILSIERNIMEGGDQKVSMAYIEECINRQFSHYTTLRLLCLLSLTSDGLPPRDYKSLKTQFLHSHGFEHMITWHNLKKLGLLTEKLAQTPTSTISSLVTSRKSSFSAISKKLHLVPNAPVDLNNPTDMSYVFSGTYTPLTCSLVENGLLRHGFTGLEEALKLLPGNITIRPAVPLRGPRLVLVCFIGGCTYAETAALRHLAIRLGYQFLVLTTAMVNGHSLMDSLVERTNT